MLRVCARTWFRAEELGQLFQLHSVGSFLGSSSAQSLLNVRLQEGDSTGLDKVPEWLAGSVVLAVKLMHFPGCSPKTSNNPIVR